MSKAPSTWYNPPYDRFYRVHAA